jgi:L-iditol 2-dehydrogenase
LVIVGIPDGNLYCPLPADLMRRRALSLSMSRRMLNVFERAMQLVATGQVDVERLLTHKYPLDQAAEAFRRQAVYDGQPLKAAIYMPSSSASSAASATATTSATTTTTSFSPSSS